MLKEGGIKMLVSSSLEGINSLLEGGYEEQIPVAIFGLPASGKSIFLIQESVFICKSLSSSALIIDTEGGNYVLISKWLPKLNKRFNADIKLARVKFGKEVEVIDDYSDTTIFSLNLRKARTFARFFGYNLDVTISDRGKFGLRFLSEAKNYCQEFIEEHNVEVLVIDSLSNPLSVFSGGLVNYPARADFLKLFFSAIQGIAEDTSTIILMSHHATFDPQNPYSEPTMYGGKWVKHNTKVSLYFEETKSKKKEQKGIRRVYLTRFFDKPRFAKKCKIRLTDEGFVDVKEEKG